MILWTCDIYTSWWRIKQMTLNFACCTHLVCGMRWSDLSAAWDNVFAVASVHVCVCLLYHFELICECVLFFFFLFCFPFISTKALFPIDELASEQSAGSSPARSLLRGSTANRSLGDSVCKSLAYRTSASIRYLVLPRSLCSTLPLLRWCVTGQCWVRQCIPFILHAEMSPSLCELVWRQIDFALAHRTLSSHCVSVQLHSLFIRYSPSTQSPACGLIPHKS